MKNLTFLLILSSFVSFGQSFTDTTDNLPQYATGITAWGDVDNDGDLDLFLSGDNNGNIEGGLYINDNNTFTLSSQSGLPALYYGAADWGDFNNDGNIDIILSGYSQSIETNVYINNGDATFTRFSASLAQVYLGDVKFGDFNNDQFLDIIVAGSDQNGNNIVKVYFNENGNSLTEASTSFPPINYCKAKLADYNDNGNLDIILSGKNDLTGNAYTKIWRNEGDNTFTELDLGFPQLWYGDMEWGDADNDGDLDLILSGTQETNGEIHLLLNDNGNFSDATNFNVDDVFIGANIIFKDFDQDNNLDLFVIGYSSSAGQKIAKLYNNDGTGVFTENTNTSFVPAQNVDADAGDYDNDGKIDLIYTGDDGNFNGITKLYHNGEILGISNDQKLDFKIYPNPAHNYVTISGGNTDFYSLKILDLTGKAVYQQTGENIINIDVSKFTDGLYFVKITQQNNTTTYKLIIK